MTGVSQPCNPYLKIVTFKQRLKKLTESLERRRKIKIVAIGSSSIAREGVVPFLAASSFVCRAHSPVRSVQGPPAQHNHQTPPGLGRSEGLG